MIWHLNSNHCCSLVETIVLLWCRRSELPLDCLVCNAAVYLPTAKEPRFTADGFEISVGTNHLGHFLLANLLLEDLKKRKESATNPPRMVIVGSITGNSNTVAGEFSAYITKFLRFVILPILHILYFLTECNPYRLMLRLHKLSILSETYWWHPAQCCQNLRSGFFDQGMCHQKPISGTSGV